MLLPLNMGGLRLGLLDALQELHPKDREARFPFA